MSPLVIFAIIVGVLLLAFFLFFRSMKTPPDVGGRPDKLERPELTGTSQYENRKSDTPKNV